MPTERTIRYGATFGLGGPYRVVGNGDVYDAEFFEGPYISPVGAVWPGATPAYQTHAADLEADQCDLEEGVTIERITLPEYAYYQVNGSVRFTWDFRTIYGSGDPPPPQNYTTWTVRLKSSLAGVIGGGHAGPFVTDGAGNVTVGFGLNSSPYLGREGEELWAEVEVNWTFESFYPYVEVECVRMRAWIGSLPFFQVQEFGTATPPTTFPTVASYSGGVLTDTATLSGFSSPTGTLTFYLYNPNGVLVQTTTRTVTGNGSYTSDPHTPMMSGLYRYQVVYSGDPLNLAIYSPLGQANEDILVQALFPGLSKYDPTNASQLRFDRS